MNTREPKNHGHTTAPRRVTRAHHDTIASAPRPKTETQLQELMSTVLSGFARDQWSKLNTIPFGECSTVVTAPQLLSQVAAVDANSSSCGEALGDESKQPSMASRLTPPRPQDSISINSIPDIARRA